MALRRAPPVEANLVNYLWPLLIVLLAPLLVPGVRWSARHGLAAAIGFAGAALLIGSGANGLGQGEMLGYALGWSIINRLREREKNRLGSRFDLGSFHDRLLSAGSISLPLVEKRHFAE